MDALPLIDLFRTLRRFAGLSQRELAAAAGVPATTVGRIEAGRVHDPRLRTVERLVLAAGWRLAAVSDAGRLLDLDRDRGWRDRGQRRYPAHLYVRRVRNRYDWWAGPRLASYCFPPPHPDFTFRLRDTEWEEWINWLADARADAARGGRGIDPPMRERVLSFDEDWLTGQDGNPSPSVPEDGVSGGGGTG